MAVQSNIYEIGSSLTYMATKSIPTKEHMSVWVSEVILGSISWKQLQQGEYDLINNNAVIKESVVLSQYNDIEIRVADTPDELIQSASDVAIVAGIAQEIADVAFIAEDVVKVSGLEDEINTVISNEDNINTVAADIANINTVASNISSVTSVSNNMGDVKTNSDNIEDINSNASNMDSINTVANAIEGGAGIGGGQFVGSGLVKGIQFMAQSSLPNEQLTIVSGTNGFSIEDYVLDSGATLTVEDNATYKIL